jgi:hypothetical protein
MSLFRPQEDRTMADRKVYHVAPHGEEWEVMAEGAERATSLHETKQKAIDAARALAMNQKPSQVIMHKEDGTIQREYTYGDDPEETEG